ncbi:hypothetical protein [Tropicimonas sp. S265A]|uniref:hypothetical protein n=1 Tax=Tropicimonas sp. S265A TaxID=3415134 RepID=UPI003C7CB8E0
MFSLRSIILPLAFGGLSLIGVAGAAWVVSDTPSLDKMILRADPIAWASRDTRPGVTRVQLVGAKASKCNRGSGLASARKLACKTSGVGMKKRGNIVFAKPPK